MEVVCFSISTDPRLTSGDNVYEKKSTPKHCGKCSENEMCQITYLQSALAQLSVRPDASITRSSVQTV
jgi:hypothetical protein